MTYEEYQQAIIVNCEAMKATRTQQRDCGRVIEAERLQKIEEAHETFVKQRKLINELYDQKFHDNAERWKAERMRLHIAHAKVIEQWREEHGISTPPYVELPSGERPNEGGAL